MWKFIKEKWVSLLLSIILGWLLWLYVNRQETRGDSLEASFEVRQPRADLQVSVDPELKRVMLKLSGPIGAIYEATRRDRNVRVVYEPKDAEKLLADGKPRELILNSSMVQNLPPDVEVTQFVPAGVEVIVQRITEQTFPVAAPATIGTPETGYEVYKAEVLRPKTALVSGPDFVLAKLTEVRPEPVDVTGLNADFRDPERRLMREYDLDGSVGRITSRATVSVLVGIRRQSAHRTITGVQIEIAQPEVRPPAKPLDIEVVSPANPMDLELEGPPEALSQIKPETIRTFIYVDMGSRKPEDSTPFYQPLVVLGLPEGVKPSKAVVVTARVRPKAESPSGTEVPKP
jgi:hypothetical protein